MNRSAPGIHHFVTYGANGLRAPGSALVAALEIKGCSIFVLDQERGELELINA